MSVQQLRQGHLAKVGVLFVDDVCLGLVHGKEVFERLIASGVRCDLDEFVDDIGTDVFLIENDLVFTE